MSFTSVVEEPINLVGDLLHFFAALSYARLVGDVTCHDMQLSFSLQLGQRSRRIPGGGNDDVIGRRQ